MIKGGYILLSKKILESDIFKKPPLYLKVWIYLLSRAQWQDYRGLKRGQLWTSIPEIQEACSYSIGYRKEVPTIKQVRGALDWLRKPDEGNANGSMIGTTKGTHGLLVTICNYSLYQDFNNYEGHSEGHNEKTMKVRTRAEYKEINEKKEIYNAHFEAFWEVYPRKLAKASARKAFEKLKVDDSLLKQMLKALEVQKKSKQWADKQFIAYPATWLNQRRWEDEAEEQPQEILKQADTGLFKL